MKVEPIQQEWLDVLAEHMIAIAEHSNTCAALKAFLNAICTHFGAERCALVTFGAAGGQVLLETCPPGAARGTLPELDALSQAGTARQDAGPVIMHPTPDQLVMMLEPAGDGDAPLLLLLEGVRALDAAATARLGSARALIRLAHAYLLDRQRRPDAATPSATQDAHDPAAVDDSALRDAIERLTAAQSLSVELINDLLSASHERLDAVINTVLARMGRFCGCDRTYLFRDVPGRGIINTHEFCAPGIAPLTQCLQDQSAHMAQLLSQALNSTDLCIARSAELPEDNDLRKLLDARGGQALLAVPLRYDGRVFGFVGYDAGPQKRRFLRGEISLIQSVANVMATMLAKRDVDERLSEIHAQQDMQRQRLHATLNVIPDILIELDEDLRILSYHANPQIELLIDLDKMIGLSVLEHSPPEVAAIAQQVQLDLEEEDVVQGYSFPCTGRGQTRHYSISAARSPYGSGKGAPRYVAILRDVTERHEQGRKIERLSRIARTTTNLVVITDRHARIEWVNPAFEARTGYQLSELVGRKPGELLQDPETDQAVIAEIREALRRVQPITCELLNVSRMGAKYWVRMTIQPIFDENGDHQGFMAVQVDVTGTRRLMQDMRAALASEQEARMQLRSAVDNMQEALIIFDANQRLVICNERYRALYPEMADMLTPGTARELLLREGLRKGLFGTDISNPKEWFQHQARKFHMRHSQNKLRQVAGRWYRETQQPTPDGGRICLMSDVTDWKDAEQQAVADRARAMDASRDGIVLITAEGHIRYVNAAAGEIMRRDSTEQMLGQKWTELLLGTEAERLYPIVRRAWHDSGFWQGESRIILPDGTARELEISATLNADQTILCIFRDISDKRRDEAEREALREALTLARRREEIGHIAAGLTHDFNNLLSVISSASQMIQHADQISLAQGMAARIAEAADQAGGLLRRMLALGKSSAVRDQIDLRRPLRDAEALVRPGLRAPVSLCVDLPNEAVIAYADSTAVVQMLMNLIINARDALMDAPPPDGTARIAVALSVPDRIDPDRAYDIGQVDPSRRYACIVVQDNGPGMNDEVRANIFTPYFSTKGDAGTGLGVPMVVNTVQDQGGALLLESGAGQGTRFTIMWPLEDIVAGAELPESPDAGASWAGQTALVYSPCPERSDQLVALLEAAGALAVPCRAQSELVALMAEDDSWDAVLLDIPDTDSLRRAEKLLADMPEAGPPVLAIAEGALLKQPNSGFAVCAGPLGRENLAHDLRRTQMQALRQTPRT
ncbi:MAG: PAS domain-containing protein [Rhodobacteraceae bacterium]|nr:PAS domain-containing protein [Paracoccaceae bacterium]